MKSVVLLDDNFAIRQLVGILLAELRDEIGIDFQLYSSENGVEGLGYIYITSPQVIIIDTTLPKYSGREVLEFLTTNKRFHDSETKVIVLEESSNDHVYPQNFYVIHKHDPFFLQELLTTIGRSLKSNYHYQPSLFRTFAKHIVRLSNRNDTLAHKNEQHNYWGESLSYIPWLLRELVISFYVAIIFLLKNQVPNESIEQTHSDLKSYRVKYYPTLVIGASAMLVVLFQALALGLPQLLLFRELLTPAAAATTFTVDSSADDPDFSPGDGFCDTDDGVGDGPCTLRAAIEEANNTVGEDTINFSIGSGFVDIETKDLPSISESLILDASTQPTASCDPLTPMIGLSNAVNDGDDVALGVNSGDVTIRGFVINGYEEGIALGADDSTVAVECNIIGLASNGLSIVGNTYGIYASGTSTFQIGGSTASQRNIIGGNFTGMELDAGTFIVQGNYIGVGVDGTTQTGNTANGILIGADNVIIGGATGTTPGGNCTGACNLISNNAYGINSTGSNGHIIGNYIGTDVSSIQPQGNILAGIKIDYGVNNVIGGDSAGERNVISANVGPNIQLRAAGTNSIIGNNIGVDATGTIQLNASTIGVDITSIGGTGSNENIVGSINVGEANIIAADIGVSITGVNTNNNIVSGNYIGTDLSKETPFSHSTSIFIESDSSGDEVHHNVLANFSSSGAHISSNTSVHDNEVFNGTYGIALSGAIGADIANNNIYSTENGIISSHSSEDNSFRSNLFSASHGIPIDLAVDGITPNDGGDLDSGENELQNFPVILVADTYAYSDDTYIEYELDSEAGDYSVEFFYTSEVHGSNHGEVTGLLCIDLITLAGAGPEAFDVTCPTQAPLDTFITAVATEYFGVNDYGNSSELAEDVKVSLIGTDAVIAITEPVHAGSNIAVTVTDIDLNTDAASMQTVDVELKNSTTNEREVLTLTETSVDSATFGGSLNSAYSVIVGADYNSVLNVKAGDTITLKYTDEIGSVSAGETITDTATVEDGLPVASTDLVGVMSGASVDILPLNNDIDPEGALNDNTLAVTTNPTHGLATVIIADSIIRYTPTAGYTGSDALMYTICDLVGQCTTGLVSISVNALTASSLTPTPISSTVTVTPTTTTTTIVPTTEPTVLRPTPTDLVAYVSSSPSSPPITPVIDILPETGGSLINSLFTAETLGETITNTAITLPVVAVLATSAYTYPGITLYAFGWLKGRRRKVPWGIVYDKLDLSPVAFARVSLYQNGVVIQDRITDLEGRFGFVGDRGQYILSVRHPGYKELQQVIDINKNEQALIINLALEPKTAAKTAATLPLRARLKTNLSKINLVIFVVGFIFSSIAVLFNPIIFNIAIFVVYLIQLVAALLAKAKADKKRGWGYIFDSANNSRIRGAFVRLYDAGEQNQIDIQMSDHAGRYGFIVKPGHYLLSVDHPNYDIPSPRQDLGRFFMSTTGKVFTNVSVKPNSVINIAISADSKANAASAAMASPFGSAQPALKV